MVYCCCDCFTTALVARSLRHSLANKSPNNTKTSTWYQRLFAERFFSSAWTRRQHACTTVTRPSPDVTSLLYFANPLLMSLEKMNETSFQACGGMPSDVIALAFPISIASIAQRRHFVVAQRQTLAKVVERLAHCTRPQKKTVATISWQQIRKAICKINQLPTDTCRYRQIFAKTQNKAAKGDVCILKSEDYRRHFRQLYCNRSCVTSSTRIALLQTLHAIAINATAADPR